MKAQITFDHERRVMVCRMDGQAEKYRRPGGYVSKFLLFLTLAVLCRLINS